MLNRKGSGREFEEIEYLGTDRLAAILNKEEMEMAFFALALRASTGNNSKIWSAVYQRSAIHVVRFSQKNSKNSTKDVVFVLAIRTSKERYLEVLFPFQSTKSQNYILKSQFDASSGSKISASCLCTTTWTLLAFNIATTMFIFNGVQLIWKLSLSFSIGCGAVLNVRPLCYL